MLATVLVYSYDAVGGFLSLTQTGILSVTDIDQSRAGRLIASTALLKNLNLLSIGIIFFLLTLTLLLSRILSQAFMSLINKHN